MANGRLKKEPGYCDYRFIDETYCKEKIAGIFIHESDKKVKRTGWDDKEKRNYCLFHSHNDDKGEFFYPEIKSRIKNANDAVLKKLAELDKKQLSEEERKNQEKEIRNDNILDFEGFYLPKIAMFLEAIFESAVNFRKAEFSGVALFEWAKFVGEADFELARFGGEASFRNANFDEVALFGWAKLGGSAHFGWAIFGGVTDFVLAEFGMQIVFSEAEFDNQSDFSSAKFRGEADFSSTTFGGGAFFSGTKFEDLADFTFVEFNKNADFNFSKFSKEASFGWVVFGGATDFSKSRFFNDSYFNEAKFEDGVSFKSSLFHKSTDFAHTAFLKTLDFTDAVFLEGELDFTRVRFPAEDTFFHNTVFNCEVLFHEQMLKGVRFTGCYLGSASFYGSDVKDAIFINSSWNRRFLNKQIQKLIKQERIGKDTPVLEISRIIAGGNRRAVLLDEYIYQYSKPKSVPKKIKRWLFFGFLMFCRGIKVYIKEFFRKKNKPYISDYILEPSELELDPLYLEHLYCQFKLAMDRNKMYSLANDFYHGEKLMETKRLWEERSFWSFLKWAFLWLYRLLAGFGNSPWRAIISLILILFASSYLLIKFNGLTVADSTEAFKRCPCKTNEIIRVVTAKPDSRQAAALANVKRSFVSGDMAELVVSLNTLDKFSKESKPVEIHGTGPPKVQAGYSLKCNYLCNVFFVSL